MSEEELRKKLNNDFYSRRIVQIEQSCPPEENLAKQVGWRSYNSQQENFQFLADVLADVANIDWSDTNTSVLDLGCGLGDVYKRQVAAARETSTRRGATARLLPSAFRPGRMSTMPRR